ncbi:unnamed protein product [Parnassius apollo]|uniref:(apollo) hypothetical protein n=1 Tax=Parnassius apollo TaxID=110799 RepID=A0A8S3X3L5_PARAO|nr:unnamed protein product [Parnassius apollo]
MDRNTMGIKEISRQFAIPSRILRRRYAAKNTTKQRLGKLIRNAWIRAATPANSLAGVLEKVLYLVNLLNKEQKPLYLRLTSVVCQIELDNQKENISEYEQNKTPPNLMQIEIDRETPSIFIDSEILDISIVEVDDSTIAEILGSNIESETPSKILIEASPIPKIPLAMSKRAKQSADTLNSKANIEQIRYG